MQVPSIVLGPSADVFLTTYNGASFPNSFLDSGSSYLFFNDSSISQCATTLISSNVYCPTPSALQLSAMLSVQTGAGAQHRNPITFEFANPTSALRTGTTIALDNIGPPQHFGGFDWGFPFFFNRAVFINYSQIQFGAAKSWEYRYLSQPPPMFDTVEMSLATGGDNAGSGVEITGKLTSRDRQSMYV
jgi:hypothetical protein